VGPPGPAVMRCPDTPGVPRDRDVRPSLTRCSNCGRDRMATVRSGPSRAYGRVARRRDRSRRWTRLGRHRGASRCAVPADRPQRGMEHRLYFQAIPGPPRCTRRGADRRSGDCKSDGGADGVAADYIVGAVWCHAGRLSGPIAEVTSVRGRSKIPQWTHVIVPGAGRESDDAAPPLA